MPQSCLLRPVLLLLGSFIAGTISASAQSDATAVIAQIAKSFAPLQPVSTVKLTGQVIWHSGASEDAGPITLMAGSDGSQSFTAQLASMGARTENQTAIGAGMSCAWARSDNAEHNSDDASCQKSVPWALPALALQLAKIPAAAGYTDLGSATLNGTAYRHLQGQLVFANLPAKRLKQSVAESTMDAYVDPQTFDLGVLRYQVHADDNPALTIQVEIRYGRVTAVNGVRIPFLIQRYINGTLQLEIVVSSAQIS